MMTSVDRVKFLASCPIGHDGTFAANTDETSVTSYCESVPDGLNILTRWLAKRNAGQSNGAAKSGGKWITIAPATLSQDAQLAFAALVDANKAAAEARNAFIEQVAPEVEALIVERAGKAIPAGKTVIVNARWGKINATVGDVRTAKAAQSFDELY